MASGRGLSLHERGDAGCPATVVPAPIRIPMSHVSSPPTEPAPAGPSRPDDWVPVERRWLGFDRASVPYALVVAGLLILMHFVIPAVDNAIAYDDPVESGDVMALNNGVTFTPPVGWNIVAGVREGGSATTGSVGKTATLVSGGLKVDVTVDPFDGDSSALLSQIRTTTDALNAEGDFHVVGAAADFTTSSGLAGRMSRYASSGANGIIAAIVQDGVGIEVVATSATDLDQASTAEVAAMLDSLAITEEAGA